MTYKFNQSNQKNKKKNKNKNWPSKSNKKQTCLLFTKKNRKTINSDKT